MTPNDKRINEIKKQITDISTRLGKLEYKEADFQAKKMKAEIDLKKSKISTTIKSKQATISKLEDGIAKIHKDRAFLLKQRIQREEYLAKNLLPRQLKERAEEERKINELRERERKEKEKYDAEFEKRMADFVRYSQSKRGNELNNQNDDEEIHDFFISHASEDKDEVARPLFQALTNIGCKVWYDEFSLEIGDSLREKIEKGIAGSRFGVVILSKNFFEKEWPKKELDGFFSREIGEGKKILPIWHNVSKDYIVRQAPILSNKLALSTSSNSIDEIADKLKKVLR